MTDSQDSPTLKFDPAEKVLMLINRLLPGLVESCPDGIIGVDRQGAIIIFNQAAEKITGLSPQEALGKLTITDIYRPPQLARHLKKLLYGPDHGGPGRLEGYEVVVVGPDQTAVPIRLSATLLFDGDEEVGSVGFFHDLTARKKMEAELRRRSITDSLTGLYNRRHFHTVLSEEIQRAKRYDRPMAVAMVDLDSFKPFNDTFGHQEGDGILQLFSDVALESLRVNDYAFRIGGDEFSMVLVETNLQQAHQAMERLRIDFQNTWPARMAYLGKKLKPVTLSIGVAQLASKEKADRLIMRADLAMYEAKKDGGDRTVKVRSDIKAD